MKEVSGLNYMASYRDPEALALFRHHSTHLRMEREKKHVSRRRKMSKTTGRANTQTRSRMRERESLHDVPIQPRDRLLNYKKPRLVALLHDALAERDQFQQHHHALLQEHMFGEVESLTHENVHILASHPLIVISVLHICHL